MMRLTEAAIQTRAAFVSGSRRPHEPHPRRKLYYLPEQGPSPRDFNGRPHFSALPFSGGAKPRPLQRRVGRREPHLAELRGRDLPPGEEAQVASRRASAGTVCEGIQLTPGPEGYEAPDRERHCKRRCQRGMRRLPRFRSGSTCAPPSARSTTPEELADRRGLSSPSQISSQYCPAYRSREY